MVNTKRENKPSAPASWAVAWRAVKGRKAMPPKFCGAQMQMLQK